MDTLNVPLSRLDYLDCTCTWNKLVEGHIKSSKVTIRGKPTSTDNQDMAAKLRRCLH